MIFDLKSLVIIQWNSTVKATVKVTDVHGVKVCVHGITQGMIFDLKSLVIMQWNSTVCHDI